MTDIDTAFPRRSEDLDEKMSRDILLGAWVLVDCALAVNCEESLESKLQHERSLPLTGQDDLRIVWDFLCPSVKPAKVDVIFVFGGLDLLVPRRAAELFHEGHAKRILVTGKSGALTKGVFKTSEARVFADEMIQCRVPAESILLEENAGNTGANVELGMKVLEDSGISVGSVILVAKPFITRRALATFALRYPDVRTLPCPPQGDINDFVDRPSREFVLRLLGEVERLSSYAQAGFIAEVKMPQRVLKAVEALRMSN